MVNGLEIADNSPFKTMTNLLKAIVYLESGHHTFRGNSIGIINKTTQLTGKAKKD